MTTEHKKKCTTYHIECTEHAQACTHIMSETRTSTWWSIRKQQQQKNKKGSSDNPFRAWYNKSVNKTAATLYY